MSGAELASLAAEWMSAWPAALEAWSRFTRLRPPVLSITPEDAERAGLTGSFAMIRLVDQSVVVSLPEVVRNGVAHHAVTILAHEVGHHVLAPATLTDHARMIARMRRALPTVERLAPMVSNLYTDLIINDRLQRSAGLDVASVYRAIARNNAAEVGATWSVYLRIYELLWRLDTGDLCGGKLADALEGDAWLGARLLRSYRDDWLDGSGRFAALMFPHLLADQKSTQVLALLHDTKAAGAGGEPAGLSEADDAEESGAVHPACDDDGGLDDDESNHGEFDDPARKRGREVTSVPTEGTQTRSAGQARQPFEYGEILRAAGLDLDLHDVAVRYYRERAVPHLIPFPHRIVAQSSEPLPEGLEPWDIGHSLDQIDWLETVMTSPRVVPGRTTVKRTWGTMDGQAPERKPFDLDLYVDSSGSMVNPEQVISYPALAGAIVCLSALRAGARVQVTLWSGSHQFTTTPGFVRDEVAILRVLTGYFGGGTAFPIHVLRDTFQARPPDANPAHVMVVSDDGVSTMFDKDERGQSGWDVSREALARARGGATLVLQMPETWEKMGAAYRSIRRARDELGFSVHRVGDWDGLIAFARAFARMRYADKPPRGAAQ